MNVLLTRRALLRVLRRALLLGLMPGFAVAQVLPPAVATASNVDGVYSALGALKPEASGHLSLDLPELAVAGPVKARVSSELPGTVWLLLLRGRSGAAAQGGAAAEPALLAALPFKAGEAAQGELEIQLNKTESFTLMAQVRGRWFVTHRQVKVGLPPAKARAAKSDAAARVAQATKPDPASTAAPASPAPADAAQPSAAAPTAAPAAAPAAASAVASAPR
ncbi:hypothetical protein J7U46_05570 [Pelomonas sp. V22]|uniref:hypothetical protein n=1 Tax=Pelomonas sp. V22 TaxID=2822139 RepID=UPI0024A9BE6F|nr:hypothetical protein [Pelomonas sp. V22]MDI4632506.1 hypothetical protein [Pelomonas sp. V22]